MDFTLLLTILIAPVIATFLNNAIAPLFAGLTADRVARAEAAARKQRALERVEQNPLCYVGATFESLWVNGNGGWAKIMDWGKITVIKKGNITVVSKAGTKRCWTLLEWEAFHPEYT